MSNLLVYSRSRSTSVEQIDDQTMLSSCRLQDTFTDAYVEIRVQLPELEIIEITSEFNRTQQNECIDVSGAFQKLKGVRIGSGLLKILKGLVADATACKQFGFMVEECCHGVILSFTKDTMMQIPEGQEVGAEAYKNMVKENIRLYNRCAAFAPGSSMVEGIDPP